MSLREDQHTTGNAWRDARTDLLDRAVTVGYGRGRGTLTAKALDELRDSVARYDQALRNYLHS